MALPMLATADALAARYGPGVVTPPSGYGNIRVATARLPNNIAAFPAVMVFPPAGELTYTSSSTRRSEHVFKVRFFFTKASGDLPRDVLALYSWLPILLDQTHAQTKLGVAGVMKSLPESYTVGQLEYAGTVYDGIEISVRVWIEDTIALVP